MDYKQSSHGCGALRLSLLATTIMAALMPAAQSVEIDTDSEDWSVRFDNTGKFNYGMRTESADDRMLATPNNNDGDYNFKDSGDTVATRFDLLTELDVVNQGNKVFASAPPAGMTTPTTTSAPMTTPSSTATARVPASSGCPRWQATVT